MPSVLQEIAQRFEGIDPDKAKELLRIEQVYTHFGLDDDTAAPTSDGDGAARRLLHYLPRMARMKGFRLYRIGVGEQANGRYARQAVALLDARHLPTPGNTLAVLDPLGITTDIPAAEDDNSRQYSFEVWQHLQHHYGYGCALLPDSQFTPA
jgi:hypothetical protein